MSDQYKCISCRKDLTRDEKIVSNELCEKCYDAEVFEDEMKQGKFDRKKEC